MTPFQRAQIHYVHSGLAERSPDREYDLSPPEVRDALKRGFVPDDMWTPSPADLAAMSYEAILARQRR